MQMWFIFCDHYLKMSQNVPKCPKWCQNVHFRCIVVQTDLFSKATAPFTGNWVWRKAHFNIQIDKVSWKLWVWVFLVQMCFVEAKASLCFAKIRQDPSSLFSLIFGSSRKKNALQMCGQSYLVDLCTLN